MKLSLFHLAVTFILIWATIVVILPIFWMFVTSVTPREELYSSPLWIIPSRITFTSGDPAATPLYYDLLFGYWAERFWHFYGNSIKVSLLTVAITLPLSLLGGYGLSRFKFRGNRFITLTLILIYMFPPTVLAAPYFIITRNLGIYDTIWALVLVNSVKTIPFATWTLRMLLDGIPKEIDEAALIDGCSRFGVLVRIIIKLAKVAVFTVSIWSFLITWNEFMFGYTLTKKEAVVITRLIYQITFQYGVTLNSIMAIAATNSIPLIILFIFFQKYIVRAMIAGWGKF